MGLQFRKSLTICKGVKLNITKTGVGVTLGTKGCHYSINSSGRTTSTIGIPGTGLYYTNSKNLKTKKKEAEKKKKQEEKEQAKQEQQQAAAQAKEEQAAQQAQQQQQDAETAAQYAEYLDAIRQIHLTCEPVIDWNSLASGEPPFASGQIGPNENAALDAYNKYQPSFTDKLLHHDESEAKKKELLDAIAAAKEQDAELLENWTEMHGFASEILKGNIDAYLDVIEQANPFEQLLDFGSDFQFGTESADRMEIEFRVKSETVVPKETAELTASGKLSVKEMTKTQYFDITQDYVCSTSIRLAREVFAMLPVKYVYIHAVDMQLNKATGNDEEMDILSVAFEREQFHKANFARLDHSDFIGTFPHNMRFKKTAGFEPVERLK